MHSTHLSPKSNNHKEIQTNYFNEKKRNHFNQQTVKSLDSPSQGHQSRRCRSLTNKNHVCIKCGNGYAFLKSLQRHLRYECGLAPRFRCPYCGARGKQRAHVKEHIRRKHPGKRLYVLDLLG